MDKKFEVLSFVWPFINFMLKVFVYFYPTFSWVTSKHGKLLYMIGKHYLPDLNAYYF